LRPEDQVVVKLNLGLDEFLVPYAEGDEVLEHRVVCNQDTLHSFVQVF